MEKFVETSDFSKACQDLIPVLYKRSKIIAEEENGENQFIVLTKECMPYVFGLRSFKLYLYMRWRIWRKDNPHQFVDLSNFYNRNLLPFAQNQTYIKDKFDVTQQAVSVWIKELIDYNLIYPVGVAIGHRKYMEIPVDVFALGKWCWAKTKENDSKVIEAYFIETAHLHNNIMGTNDVVSPLQIQL